MTRVALFGELGNVRVVKGRRWYGRMEVMIERYKNQEKDGLWTTPVRGYTDPINFNATGACDFI